MGCMSIYSGADIDKRIHGHAGEEHRGAFKSSISSGVHVERLGIIHRYAFQ